MNWKLFTPLVLCLSASALAQSGGVAGIGGTVKDPSGSVVPNAKVIISRTAQGQVRSLETNGSGVFNAPGSRRAN